MTFKTRSYSYLPSELGLHRYTSIGHELSVVVTAKTPRPVLVWKRPTFGT